MAALLVVLTVATGLAFYGLPIYLSALVAERDLSLTSVSGATAVFFVASGLVGPAVARLLERADPRVVVVPGAALAAAALLGLGRATSVWQVYAAYGAFGAGYAATSLVPATALVAGWFSARRTLALSVATSGLSVGGIAVTPFLARAVEGSGLVSSAPWLALAYLLGVVPVTLALVRSPPSPPMPTPVPTPSAAAPADEGAGSASPATSPLRSRYWRVVTGVHALAMLAQVGALTHLYEVVDLSTDAATAATAVSVVAASSLVGRLVAGAVGAALPLRGLYGALLLVQAVALLALSVAGTRPSLLLASSLFGATVGTVLMLHPLLLVERFGAAGAGRSYAASQLVATVGVASGPFVVGALADVTSYAVALPVAAGATLLGVGLLPRSGPANPGRTTARASAGAAGGTPTVPAVATGSTGHVSGT